MTRRAWLTPAEMPDTFDCRALFIPVGRDWEAILRGAFLLLIDPYNFEALPGRLPVADVVQVFGEMFNAWLLEDCPMFAGMVVPAACATSPGPKWLLCDGSEYDPAQYPALYAAIGLTFGAGSGSNFRVPDLAGRMPVGVGSGSGLTQRDLADTGGEESHVLTAGEMPEHSHALEVYAAGAPAEGGFEVLPGDTATGYTGLNGSDDPHNNMPPFLALNFFIYTG